MSYDDTLIKLQQKVALKPQMETKLRELQDQRRVYDRKVISLRVAFRKEQEDVEKLEGRSLANYYFHVIGKLDDKLDQERQEAYAAKVKLDSAEHELAEIEKDIQDVRSQLTEIRIAEAQYIPELEKKRAALRASGALEGERILEIEQEISALEAQKEEIQEAISTGRSAKGTVDRILSALGSADGWNTWDMIGGDGIITHMAKYSYLDDAQDMVLELQSKLRNFKTELADVQIGADLQVSIDSFLQFADYFFDGLFADWAVRNRIKDALSTAQKTSDQINKMLTKLCEMEASADCEIKKLKSRMDALIVNF